MNTLLRYNLLYITGFVTGVLAMANIITMGFTGYSVLLITIAIGCQLICNNLKPQAMLLRIIKRAGINAAKMCEPGYTEDQYRNVYRKELADLLEAHGYDNPRELARELVQRSDEDMN